MRFSNPIPLLIAAVILSAIGLAFGESTDGGAYLDSPSELKPPIRLVSANLYLDAGSIDGKLCDKDGRIFYFFLDQNGFDPSTHGLYIFDAHKKRHKAMFETWAIEDLCRPLESAIKEQFLWDAQQKRLIPKNPSELEKPENERFTSPAARRLLLFCERTLARSTSYMK